MTIIDYWNNLKKNPIRFGFKIIILYRINKCLLWSSHICDTKGGNQKS